MQESSSSNIAVKPGEYRVGSATLEGIDIEGLIAEVNIYQSMFNDAITGNVVITDSNNIIKNIPIIGEEILKLKLSNPPEISLKDGADTSFEGEFIIYKITNRTLDRERTQTYVMNFIDRRSINSNLTTISKAYLKSPISQYVAKICAEEFGVDIPKNSSGIYTLSDSDNPDFPVEIEETLGKENFVIPNWTPFYTLNWLASKAKSRIYEGTSFVFYQTRKKMVFKSLESIYDGGHILNYRFAPKLQGELPTERKSIEKSTHGEHPLYNTQLIEEYVVKNDFDLMHNIPNGMYANVVYSHDIVKRTINTEVYDYLKDYDKYKHLNSDKLITEKGGYNSKPKSSIKIVSEQHGLFHDGWPNWIPNKKIGDNESTHGGMFTTGSSSYNADNSYTRIGYGKRIAQINQLNNSKISFTVTGDFSVDVGSKLMLLIPSPEVSETMQSDRFLSGLYVITSMRHKIDPTSHMMIIEVSKDTFTEEVS